jgi:hypothetical protein
MTGSSRERVADGSYHLAMTRRLLVLTAVVALTFGWFDPATAAEAPTFPGDPPFERLLATGPSGYRLDDSLAGADLRFDVSEFRSATSSRVPDDAFDDGAVYGVTWRHPDGVRVVVVNALSATRVSAARDYLEGAADNAEVSGPADETTIAGAVVRSLPAPGLVMVTAIAGTRAVIVLGQTAARDETIAFARTFVERMQQLPPRSDVEEENDSVAFRAGRVVGMALTVALVVGVVVWLVRRNRRPAPVPAPGPGWYGPPGSPPQSGPPPGWPPQSGPPPGWSPPQPGPPAPPPSNLPPPPSNLPPPPSPS